jgi:hypothetical protein
MCDIVGRKKEIAELRRCYGSGSTDLVKNEYSDIFTSVVTLDDLFATY